MLVLLNTRKFVEEDDGGGDGDDREPDITGHRELWSGQRGWILRSSEHAPRRAALTRSPRCWGANETPTYQFSCIHRMASSSLNSLSNSYSCRASTDMLTVLLFFWAHTLQKLNRCRAALCLFSLFPRSPRLASLVLLSSTPRMCVSSSLVATPSSSTGRPSLRPLPHRGAPRVLAPPRSRPLLSEFGWTQFKSRHWIRIVWVCVSSNKCQRVQILLQSNVTWAKLQKNELKSKGTL